MVNCPTPLCVEASWPEEQHSDFTGSVLLGFEELLTRFLARRLRKALNGLKMSSQQHWPEFKAQKINEVGPQRPKTGVQKRLGGRSSGKEKAKQGKLSIRSVVRIVSHKPIVNQ